MQQQEAHDVSMGLMGVWHMYDDCLQLRSGTANSRANGACAALHECQHALVDYLLVVRIAGWACWVYAMQLTPTPPPPPLHRPYPQAAMHLLT